MEVIPSKRKNEEMMKADGNMNKRGGAKKSRQESKHEVTSKQNCNSTKNENQEDNV